jgi:hypothetical protein
MEDSIIEEEQEVGGGRLSKNSTQNNFNKTAGTKQAANNSVGGNNYNQNKDFNFKNFISPSQNKNNTVKT